jgi:hypothetical protein
VTKAPTRDEARRAAQEAAGEAEPHLRITPVSKIPVKATEWLWDQRIPLGALTLLPGREGTGKSTFGAWLAARVTKGELPGVYQGIPKSVFYVATEDDWSRTIAPRLRAAGADLDRVYKISVDVAGGLVELSLPQHGQLLRDDIRKREVGLVFLDPMMSVISGALDTHKDRETRMALEPMSAIAMDTDSAFVGLAHFSKGMTTDTLNLVMASKAFTAVPRAVIGMARDEEADEENTVVLSQIKSNLGPLDIPSLKFTFRSVRVEADDGRDAHVGQLVMLGESERSVNDIIAGRGDEADQATWNAACWWLYDYVHKNGGEVPSAAALDAGKSEGHSKDSVKRASRTLNLTKRKEGFRGAWTWVYDPKTSKQPAGPRPQDAPARSAKPRKKRGSGGTVVPIRPDVDGGGA